MANKRSGKIVKAIEGPRAGEVGYVYYVDQTKEMSDKGKIAVRFETGKVLMDPKKLKPIGFFD